MPDDRASLKAHIRDTPVAGSPAQMRTAFARLAGPQPDLAVEEIGGVACSVAGHGALAAIWLHGGGYVFGGAQSHGHTVARMAQLLGGKVILPHYRLAPEAPWPAQLEDACAVLDAMPGPIPVIGDSAGGHLALNAAFKRPDKITALALISPNTDRTDTSETRASNSPHDLMNDAAQDAHLASRAFPDTPDAAVDASPILGPLHSLPPMFLTCATNEVLADDTLLLARSAAHAGAQLELHVEPNLFHLWTLWPRILPEAARTLALITRFIQDKNGT